MFITLEGGEGAGKSTQARRLAAALTARGQPVLLTREPGGAAGAEALRGLLLARPFDARAEMLLHFAARREHLVRSIRPALAAGATVVCDRFADSTFAYQVGGQGGDPQLWAALVTHTLEGIWPDLTFLLDLPVEVGLARAAARGEANRYEAADPDFHHRVRLAYHALAAREPERFRLIDATLPEDEVAEAILACLPAP
ncbi:MAG: dTMP kinase [Rhodovarius sp.]|nr:dTMP kinase [Rhodovarius sp.]MCX7933085.1 dTMP kinase [Rhodovarius sp.]MDW8314142.1 dTMP kinase [Rhodovarius sp.]